MIEKYHFDVKKAKYFCKIREALHLSRYVHSTSSIQVLHFVSCISLPLYFTHYTFCDIGRTEEAILDTIVNDKKNVIASPKGVAISFLKIVEHIVSLF